MADILHVDFGAEETIKRREAQEKLARLLELIKQTDEGFLDDPGKFFDMAAKEIGARNSVIRRAYNTARCPMPVREDALIMNSMRKCVVDADELDRLRECAAIIGEWVNNGQWQPR